MLFSKSIPDRCAYCLYSTQISEDEAVCKKQGVVHLTYKCRHYVYDPTRRVPPEPEELPSGYFSEKDFSLDPEKR